MRDMGLTPEEEVLLVKIHTPVLRDREGSYWKWDHDTHLYHILDAEGNPISEAMAPGATREQIDQLYGPTVLVDESTPHTAAVANLFQAMRNQFIID